MKLVPVDEEPEVATPFFRHPTNYQPNTFTESRQEFTQLEKKLVILVINQMGWLAVKQSIPPGQNLTFHIPYTELTRDRYDDIAAAANSLTSKKLSFLNERTGDFNYIVPFPQVQSVVIKGKKHVEITMFATVVPHFAELGQRYTQYDINIMLSLPSVYAQRLYEIVSMFLHTKRYKFRYTVERLRQMLNYPESQSYNDFKKNALIVAQRELREKAGILFEWNPTRKEGKRILEIEFIIKTARQLAAEGVEEDRSEISQMPYHEALRMAWQFMATYSLADWQKEAIAEDSEKLEVFLRINSEFANGLRPDVVNQTAYLVKSLNLDQTNPNTIKPLQITSSRPRVKTVSSPSVKDSARTNSTQAIGSIIALFPTPDQES